MKISAAQAYCILDTVGSSILTKSGEISVSYLLELPEAYSLDRSDLEERHNELFRAFQYVRTGFIHKQDVFLRRKFKPEYVIEGEGYIQTAERKYFDGREYLHHFCILSFTLSGLQSLEKAYQPTRWRIARNWQRQTGTGWPSFWNRWRVRFPLSGISVARRSGR